MNENLEGTCLKCSDVEKIEEMLDKLVVIKFNGASGTSMGVSGPKYELLDTELPAILTQCIRGLEFSFCEASVVSCVLISFV